MKFTVQLDGDWEKIAQSEVKSAEIAVTRGIALAGQTLKTYWRNQVTRAGLGTRLGNSIRLKNYPPNGEPSLGASSLVFTKAPKLIRAFDDGPTITARNKLWLAIPVGAAKNMKGAYGRKITPGEWQFRTGRMLKFISGRGRTALLVDIGNVLKGRGLTKGGFYKRISRERKNDTIPVFVLVPRVKLEKRLDVASAATAVVDQIPSNIKRFWK